MLGWPSASSGARSAVQPPCQPSAPAIGDRGPGEEAAHSAASLAGGFSICTCSLETVAAFGVGGESASVSEVPRSPMSEPDTWHRLTAKTLRV